MSDAVAEILATIAESCLLIRSRFQHISNAGDFLRNAESQMILDSIAMRLQIIGENVKSISKIEPDFIERHPQINWKGIMRLRDIISHHYDAVDHEIVFDVCQRRIPELLDFVEEVAR